MKYTLFVLFCFIGFYSFSQTQKDSLFTKDINALVEELEFMYGYDQLVREYTIFKTFNKNITDSIENLDADARTREIAHRHFISNPLKNSIWKHYITPMDSMHTKRLLEITEVYGFPGVKRIKSVYHKDFDDPEFNPYLILVHAPEVFWDDIKRTMKKELEEGRINQCTYGHILWHISGRKSLQPMLDNGYVLVTEDGQTIVKSTCQ